MRLASYSPYALMVFAALGCALACGGDDDTSSDNKGGDTSMGGSGAATGGEGGMAAAVDSQLCTDLGGPNGIDGVVRGDGKTDAKDAFNGFKFEKDGRQASVLLNAATDPCIGQQFASLLTAERADDLEHFAECLSLFVQNAAGCAVAYDADKSGKACKSMKTAHLGRGITEEDYTALITDAATALIAAGVKTDSEQFKAVAGALTADDLKKDIITNTAAEFSQPGAMCSAAGGAGAGGAGAGGAAGVAQCIGRPLPMTGLACTGTETCALPRGRTCTCRADRWVCQ
jgi:hypothetical protein